MDKLIDAGSKACYQRHSNQVPGPADVLHVPMQGPKSKRQIVLKPGTCAADVCMCHAGAQKSVTSGT